jgi:VWFA-related protein
MSQRTVFASLATALAILALGRPEALSALAAGSRVYVSVADSKNKPVTGLTAADFKVAIDDKEQEILSVEPASQPIDVVIITDRLGLDPAYSNFTVQHALSGFVKGIRTIADSRIALTTFDGPVVRITGLNTPPADLNKALGRLSTTDPSGAMLDAVVDAAEMLSESKAERRAIFAVFAAYKRDTSASWNDRTAMTLWRSAASLWSIEVQSLGGPSGGNVGRESVVNQGSVMSGGTHVSVASGFGLENNAKQMADLIVKQYVINYAPGADPNTGLRRKIAVNRNGAKIMFPSWVAR